MTTYSNSGSRPEQQRCFACGGKFDCAEGPAHPYMLSTPGCWRAYGELLAREYQDAALFGAVHRLTVDAYALQHPGAQNDRRASRSVWIHYAALQLAIEDGRPSARIPALMQKLASGPLPPLLAATPSFSITHADVVAKTCAEHVDAVRVWARSTYEAWSALKEPIQTILRRL